MTIDYLLLKMQNPKLITIVLFIFLCSCGTSSGTKSAVKLYKNDNLEIGLSLDEITKKYGNYSSSWVDESDNNLYQYFYTKANYDLISWLPIINHFGWAKTQSYEVLLIFDSKNQLISEKKFYHQAKSRNGLVCNPEIYSCIRKIY